MPVCMGVFTGWRSIMPGAGLSIMRYSSTGMSPPPSMGAPRASTTRPIIPSDTPIPAVLPVRYTAVPSLTSSTRPNRMQPIRPERSSCTMPRMPPSNSRISP
jgi:hypothetical protein